MVWAIMWFFLVYNSPATHPRISVEEREYIEKALDKKAGGKVTRTSITCSVHLSNEVCFGSLQCLPITFDLLIPAVWPRCLSFQSKIKRKVLY